jgi:uncharacterized membrane protein YfcA
MQMSRKLTSCGFLAAVIATAISGILYVRAASDLATIGAIGEGSGQEISHAVDARNFRLLFLCISGILAVIFLIRLVRQKPSDGSPLPPK